MATSIPQTPAERSAALSALHDPAVRRAIRADPQRYALDNGIITEGMEAEVVVVENTPDTLYFPVARAGLLAELHGEELAAIQAAGKAGTAGTAASYSSFSTITSSLASGGTVGTLGTAGSG